MSTETDCSAGIPSDPEIAGIGIRISVYIQVILSFTPMAISIILFDLKRPVNRKQMKSLINVQTSLLILGISMSISAFIQSFTTSLTVYHSLIVLSLEWLITISSVSLALHMISNAYALAMFDRDAIRDTVRVENPTDARSRRPLFMKMGISAVRRMFQDRWMIVKLTTMIMGPAIQMMFTSIFGLRLFTKLSSIDTQTPSCTTITIQSFIGRDISVLSPSVKKFWIVAYALTVFPGLNVYIIILALAVCAYAILLLTPIFVFLFLFVKALILSCFGKKDPADGGSMKSVKSESKEVPEDSDQTQGNPHVEAMVSTASVHGQVWGSRIALSSYMISTLTLDVIIIASLELTISRNKKQPGDDVWTFGQMLSMLLLVPGIWGVIHDGKKAAEAYRESSTPGAQVQLEGSGSSEKTV